MIVDKHDYLTKMKQLISDETTGFKLAFKKRASSTAFHVSHAHFAQALENNLHRDCWKQDQKSQIIIR